MPVNISIIIPVYNGERFLEMTLDSLVEQSYQDCEIIAVNDGSTDSSLEILQRYAAVDSRINIITTKNQGICRARNTGIKAAKGRYLMFCDHDDKYHPEYVQKAYSAISDKDYDYVKFGCREILLSDQKIIKSNPITLPDKEFKGSNASHILYEYTNYHEYIWDGIYKKEIIVKVKAFDPRFIAGEEDVDLFLKLVEHAESCATVSWTAYTHFERRESSTSQKYSDNTYNARIEMYEKKMDLAKKNGREYQEYCEIKTKNLLYTILAVMANKSCALPFG